MILELVDPSSDQDLTELDKTYLNDFNSFFTAFLKISKATWDFGKTEDGNYTQKELKKMLTDIAPSILPDEKVIKRLKQKEN